MQPFAFRKFAVVLQDGEPFPEFAELSHLTIRRLGPEELIFVYVGEQDGIPAALAEKYPVLAQTARSADDHPGVATVKSLLDEAPDIAGSCTIRHEVLSGDAAAVAKFAKQEDVDLLIVAAAPSDESRSRAFARRLLYESPCSVAVVPKGAATEIDGIVFATNLLEPAAASLKYVSLMAQQHEACTIHAVSAFPIPWGYHKTGKPREEIERLIREEHTGRIREQLADADFAGHPVKIHCLAADNAARTIVDVAESERADVIVVGSSSRQSLPGRFVGSVAEELVDITPIVLICARRKGDVIGFFDALERL
jgi:nucleotide-binding universal stress UspA family protein